MNIRVEKEYIYINNKKYKCTYLKKRNKYQVRILLPNLSKKKAYYGETPLEIKNNIINDLNCYSPQKNVIEEYTNDNNKKLATEVFDEMFNEKHRCGLTGTYLRRNQRVYKMYILPIIENKYIDEITISDINNILNCGFDRNFTKRSMNKFLEVLLPTFELALDEEYINKSPLTSRKLKLIRKEIDKKSKAESDPVNYSKHDIKNINSLSEKYHLSSKRKPFRYFPAFIFMINTGCRIGEICALKHSDIIIKEGVSFICISKTFQCIPLLDNNLELTGKQDMKISDSTKTESGKRYIPLNEQALHALKLMKESDDKFNINSEFIFSRLNGSFTSTNMLRKSFSLLENLAKLPNGTVHSLRHLFSSLLTSKNVNPKVHSYLMGHSTGHLATDIYSNALTKDLVDATKDLTDYADESRNIF
ncbi:site-specific integrase [Clostridium butyricum]|uniref:site-specific integrase n=1 Tax=Clostridium butyricum TaxID=1492 RepID=UPI002AB30B08|nr:site-specific integrase [Clostridium butyricum]